MKAGMAIVLMTVFLCGCATTGAVSEEQAKLQNRVKFLEAELDRKNQEIRDLQNDVITGSRRETPQDYRQRSEADRHAITLSLRQVQQALRNAGLYKGPVDGKAGRQTMEAIKAFQKANGLNPDGVVGGKTSDKLRRYLKGGN